MLSSDVRGPDILLAVEVAVSTLDYDLRPKPRIYARCGMLELWAIDAIQRCTHVHRGPQGDSWASITEHGPDFELTHTAIPGFAMRLRYI